MYMKKLGTILLVITLLAGCQNVEEQPTGTVTGQNIIAQNIDADRAYETVMELTKEKYNGRLAGTEENLMAAEYIAAEFESAGLESPEGITEYFQYYDQKNIVMNTGSEFEFMTVSGDVESALTAHVDVRDMVRFPGTMASGERIGEMVHVTDLKQFNDHPEALAGKILLINHEIYDPNNPGRLLNKAMKLSPKPAGIFIHRDNRYNEYFLVSKYIPDNMLVSEFDNTSGPGVFYLTAEGFMKCIDALREGKLLKYSTDYTYENYSVPNVIGYLPATIEKSEGTLMFSAHFDHVGTNGDGSYNPGALDNASGVAAIIELARVIEDSLDDRAYNFVFVAFNGEEESLLGASHYVSDPVFPLDSTTLVNFDMVGSSRERALNINVNNFAMGDTQEELIEMASELGLPAHKDFGGASDNIPFELNGVDAVLLIHMDLTDIHTRLDTADNVDPESLKDVLNLVVHWLNVYKID